MLERKKFIGSKSAAISIEITLSLVMSVVALFFVLGLFGNNLQEMAQASGINNLFNRDNNVEKTFDADSAKYVAGSTPTQVNVQLVGDQGLNYFITNAQATISKYKENPPENQSEIEDLAKAVAIAKIMGTLSPNDELLFDKGYKIYIEPKPSKNTILSANGRKLSYRPYDDNTYTDSERIALAKTILSGTFQ